MVTNDIFSTHERIHPDVLRRLLVEPSVNHTKMDDVILRAIKRGVLMHLRIYLEEFHIPLPSADLVCNALEDLWNPRFSNLYKQIETVIREYESSQSVRP